MYPITASRVDKYHTLRPGLSGTVTGLELVILSESLQRY